MKIKYILLLIISLSVALPSFSQSGKNNTGVSKSIGSVSNGRLVNAYKMPYKGNGFWFFSSFDYYVLRRCFVHSSIHKILVDSYNEMSEVYPDYRFRLMECSKKKGGRPFPHRILQNGTSVDFMTPLIKGDKVITRYDKIGIWRYLLKFDENGQLTLNRKIEIDFDKMALHILTLEKHARKNGYKIKKVILETNLKDETGHA